MMDVLSTRAACSAAAARVALGVAYQKPIPAGVLPLSLQRLVLVVDSSEEADELAPDSAS